jgi:ribosomal protein S18 acetylase RimI-like enzyme
VPVRPLADGDATALDVALGEATAAGLTRRERCFVAVGGEGRVEGLIAYGDPSADGAVVVELLDLPWRGDYRSAAEDLLASSMEQLSPRPIRLEYLLDVPHPWHPHAEERRRALERLGFRLARATRRWEWRRETRIPRVDDPLSYRPPRDAAELEDAVLRISEDSLDRRIRADRERLGPVADARRQAAFLLGLDHEAHGYELAYDEGRLAGLAAAARIRWGPIVALVGVVPELRGRGHGLRLLLRATRRLAEAGAEKIRGDSDELNEPMRRCFRRAGYRQFAIRAEYVRDA